MKQYEYKVQINRLNVLGTMKKLEDKMSEKLNEFGTELGAEGWELVSCSMIMGELMLSTFKREIQ